MFLHGFWFPASPCQHLLTTRGLSLRYWHKGSAHEGGVHSPRTSASSHWLNSRPCRLIISSRFSNPMSVCPHTGFLYWDITGHFLFVFFLLGTSVLLWEVIAQNTIRTLQIKILFPFWSASHVVDATWSSDIAHCLHLSSQETLQSWPMRVNIRAAGQSLCLSTWPYILATLNFSTAPWKCWSLYIFKSWFRLLPPPCSSTCPSYLPGKH